MRRLRWVLVLLVVLGGLLVVADRVGAWIAQRTVADQVAAELADNQVDSTPPEVTIQGVPFLTQVGAGRYQEVTLVLREVGISTVRLSQVELVATGVTAAPGTLIAREGPIDAERVDGEAMIGYGDVADLTGLEGLELAAGEAGAMDIRLPTELVGEPVTLVGTAEVSVAEHTVQLRVDDLAVEESDELPNGAEQMVDQTIEDIRARLTLDVPLPALPYGLTVDSVQATQAGLVVEVSARDVPLAR